jgi:glycosyltransferase involved in cell wall biosynthesis
MAEPSVSVVIPAFRAERTIQRAIDSVLAQSVPVQEVIVVDDGSPDDLAAIVQRHGAPVILVRQANRGAAHARNTGIERSTGTYVAFLDADDYWEPRKLEYQLAVFARAPGSGHGCQPLFLPRPPGYPSGEPVWASTLVRSPMRRVWREGVPAGNPVVDGHRAGTAGTDRAGTFRERFGAGRRPRFVGPLGGAAPCLPALATAGHGPCWNRVAFRAATLPATAKRCWR